jgi:hypothetical protein
MTIRTRTLFWSSMAIIAASPVMAHVGDHSDHSLRALISHLLEWDHLAMIAGAAVLATVAFRKFRNRTDKTKAQ